MEEPQEQHSAAAAMEKQDIDERMAEESSPGERSSKPAANVGDPSSSPPSAVDNDKDSSHDQDNSDEEADNDPPVEVGGEIETPAFALLAGVVDSNTPDDDDSFHPVSIPITRLPATLGRSHDTLDPNFFGLGQKKAVSRQQCRIFYQDAYGGTLVMKSKGAHELSYQPPPPKNKQKQVIPLSSGTQTKQGFYAIENLGKNKITIGGGKTRLEQGQVAQLESGTPIKISNYCLYFLLPTDAKGTTKKVPNPDYKKPRKRPAPSTTTSSGPPTKKNGGPGGSTTELLKELERQSPETLIQDMKQAEATGVFERRHKYIGGIVALHGMRDAAHDKTIRKLAKEGGGVSRSVLMEWLQDSPVYGDWVQYMLSKVELSSYQSNISKALQKAGYERIGSTGRFVKWKLPPTLECEESLSNDDDDDDDKQEGADAGGGSDKDSSDDGDKSKEGGGDDKDESADDDEGGEHKDQEDEKDSLAESSGEKGEAHEDDDEAEDDDEDEDDDDKQSLPDTQETGDKGAATSPGDSNASPSHEEAEDTKMASTAAHKDEDIDSMDEDSVFSGEDEGPQTQAADETMRDPDDDDEDGDVTMEQPSESENAAGEVDSSKDEANDQEISLSESSSPEKPRASE